MKLIFTRPPNEDETAMLPDMIRELRLNRLNLRQIEGAMIDHTGGCCAAGLLTLTVPEFNKKWAGHSAHAALFMRSFFKFKDNNVDLGITYLNDQKHMSFKAIAEVLEAWFLGCKSYETNSPF